MVTLAVLALMFGTCLIIASVVSLLLRANENRERRLVERTAPTPIGTWRPRTRTVAAVGTTAYGPGGPVIAPVTGADCAWFAVKLVRSPSRRSEDQSGEDVLFELSAPLPPTLTDESGSVLIDPRILAEQPNLDDPIVTELTMRIMNSSLIDTAPPVVPRKFLKDIRGYESVQLWETRLGVGRRAYALGSVGRAPGRGGGAVLQPTRRGLTVFTGDDLATVRQRRKENASSSRQLAIFLGRAGILVTLASGALLFFLV